MEILKLKPVYKQALWGGNKLKTLWNKNSDKEIISESWELSTHKDGKSIVCNGINSGKTLCDILTDDMIGEKAKKYSRFPLLIKLIDANKNLSVQVHPNDEYAEKYENDYGKTEMWYICDSEKGGGIYLGFKQNVTKEQVSSSIENGGIEKLLNFIPVKKGDSFLINSGTIHAICSGVTICEIQQSSNVTYRVYDYNRIDKTGKKRELHIDKALDVINYKKYENEQKSENVLAECKYFTVKKYNVNDILNINCDKNSFNAVNIIDGKGSIENINFEKGDTLFIPANYGEYNIKGKAEIIVTNVN